jgi:putative flippase GtrA
MNLVMSQIQEMAARLYRSRLVRTLFVGALAVVVQTIIFEAVAVWLGFVSPSTGVVIGAEFGIFTNFFLNNYLSFSDRRSGHMMHRLLRFHTIVLGSVVIQWLCVFVAQNLSASLLVIHAAYAAGIIIGFVWNYNWYRLWVWKHRETSSDLRA